MGDTHNLTQPFPNFSDIGMCTKMHENPVVKSLYFRIPGTLQGKFDIVRSRFSKNTLFFPLSPTSA